MQENENKRSGGSMISGVRVCITRIRLDVNGTSAVDLVQMSFNVQWMTETMMMEKVDISDERISRLNK